MHSPFWIVPLAFEQALSNLRCIWRQVSVFISCAVWGEVASDISALHVESEAITVSIFSFVKQLLYAMSPSQREERHMLIKSLAIVSTSTWVLPLKSRFVVVAAAAVVGLFEFAGGRAAVLGFPPFFAARAASSISALFDFFGAETAGVEASRSRDSDVSVRLIIA
jgi:hypothetical protein